MAISNLFKLALVAMVASTAVANPLAERVEVAEPLIECEICETLIDFLQRYISDDTKTITSALEDVCKLLPSSDEDECVAFIDKYSDQIITAIVNSLNSKTICAKYCKMNVLKLAGDCTETTETACDADSKCTWCKSEAVPSSCNTLADAKKLPPGVFVCDTKKELAPFADCTESSETACDADSKCTWCKSEAVPSSCNTLADAKKLPPGVFVCDTKKVSDGTECEICDALFDALDSTLDNSADAKQIIDAIIGPFCNSAIDPIPSTCLSFFESIGNELLSDVAAALTPTKVCVGDLHVCTNTSKTLLH